MQRIILPILFLTVFFRLNAQTITWANSTADIIYSKCTSCHRDGGVAPFALESYEETQLHAFSIASAVESGKMPPWPPDQNYTRFAHERSLTDDQRTKLLNWLNDGMPRGDQSKEPPVPVFPSDGAIKGTPDLSLLAPMFTVHATQDIYQCFVVSNPTDKEMFIKAMDVIPGNRNIVHHVLVHQDTTGECRKLDAQTPEPGYVSFGGVGANDAKLIGAWVPGASPSIFPDNMGVRLAPKGEIVIQIHYPYTADGQTDQTKLNIYFAKDKNVRQVYLSPLLGNYAIFLPKNQVKTLEANFKIPNILNNSYSILTIGPHMHLIGRKMKVFSVNGIDTTKLINIENWDFHWQGSYLFKKPVVLKGGSTMYAIAEYDNTSSNPNNPNNPPKNVTIGEATTDEMMLVYFGFMLYQPGDENINLENVATGIKETTEKLRATTLTIFENKIQFYCDDAYYAGLYDVIDLNGKCITSGVIQSSEMEINLPNAINGVYFLRLNKGQHNEVVKFMKL